MTVVSAILGIGNYDSPNTFFEMDYAKKWVNAGYKSAFFDIICCRHIGRLTSEIKNKTVKNAYELNNTNQFSASKTMKVVNLKRRADRREAMTEEFKKANFSDYVFIEAVDGKDLSPTNELKKLFEGNDFGNRIGVIGCALTHYNLWKMLLAGREDYFIIFEDDVKLSPNFTTKLEAIKDAMKACDYLHLGYHMTSKNRKLHEDVYTNDTGKLTVTTLKKELYIGGTFAYSINKNGARILVDYIEKNGIKHGIDYVVKICNPLKNMEIQPQIAFSEWYEVPGQKVDTDIQTERASLDFKNIVEEEFEFFEGLDHIGDDICFQKLSVDECIKLAKTMPQCVAFNTLGFFKKAVDVKKLVKSQYFSPTDGIYVKTVPQKKPNTEVVVPKINPIKVKMLCDWEPSQDFVNRLLKGCMPITHFDITSSDDADYFVIFNKAIDGEYYDPSRTIVLQMEPWVYDDNKNWGMKTWGEWAYPDPKKFLHVNAHRNYLNPASWVLGGDLVNLPSKEDKVSSILSEKVMDTGHSLRISFIKESTKNLRIDVYGRENYHNIDSYVGTVPDDDRYNVYSKYKYIIAAENNSEHNYATEKIWEPLLCECLPFYWGCPNLEEVIDPQSFVRLPLEDPEKAAEIIRKAIEEDWWSQRIDAIRASKTKIMNKLGFYTAVSNIIAKSQKTKAVILTLHSSKDRIPIVEKLQSDLTNIGLENEVFYGVNGKDLITSSTKVVYNNEVMKYNPNVRLNGDRMKIGEFGASWSHIKIYQKLVADEDADNYLVLEDDAHVVGDLNILRDLPLDFDIAHVARSDMRPFIITSQVNSSFFNIEKDFFNRLTGYVVSKAGAKKLLAVTDGYINVPCDDLLSNSFLRDQIRVIVPKAPIFDFPIDIQSTTDFINNSNN
jgi:GR25 family glycosyltransferase involved in LPS biosynthesis